jgi:dienelactone hydrolase
MAQTLHPCCDPSTPTPIWEGETTGDIITYDSIEIYISKPEKRKPTPDAKRQSSVGEPQGVKAGTRVLLFLPEAHGIYLPNSQLLADSFASHLNCDVIMPDQFAGENRLPKVPAPNILGGSSSEVPQVVPWTLNEDDTNYENRGIPLPLKENTETSEAIPFLKPLWWKEEEFEKWLTRHEPPVTDPILQRVVLYIRETYGEDVRIGGVGYCFGGRYVMRLMGSGVIDVGMVNHPSFFTMEEVKKLGKGKKLAMYAAETDDILPPEKRRETEDHLSKAGATWTSTVFCGTKHGFSVRGDLTVKEVRLAKEKAFKGAVEWFDDWL